MTCFKCPHCGVTNGISAASADEVHQCKWCWRWVTVIPAWAERELAEELEVVSVEK